MRKHDHAVEPKICRLGNDAFALAALGRQHGFSRFLTNFFQNRVVTQHEQASNIRSGCITAFARVDHVSELLQDRVAHFFLKAPYISSGSVITGSTACHCSPSRRRKKQLSRPVWQAMPPVCSTAYSTTSPSQSRRISTTFWRCPDSSPLCHSCLRERDQYTAGPDAAVATRPSRFAHATISTRALPLSCAMTGTRPSASKFTSSSQFTLRHPHRYAALSHVLLGLQHREFAVVENRSRQDRIGAPGQDTVSQMLQSANASRCDNRHGNCVSDCPR